MSQEFQGTTGNEKATVKYSMYTDTSQNLVGKTVQQARQQFAAVWEIDPQASAWSGKTQLKDDYIIQNSDEIVFVKRQGEKGQTSLY